MKTEQSVILKKLHVLLHRSLVEARNLAMAQQCQQVYDLADTFEQLPMLLADWEDDQLKRVRTLLTYYQAKYHGRAYDYLAILDMDEAAFQEVYRLPELDTESEGARWD